MLKMQQIRVAVHYRVAVMERGREVFSIPRKRNLLTDSGLEKPATVTWANCFRYAVVGTGTNPVKRDSGAVTVSRAGSTLTASAGFFEAGDVGRLFKFDSGEECYITAFTDSQHVTSDISGTVAAAEGTVWYVNRTGLQTEAKRTLTCANESGDNGRSLSVNTWTMKRTFIFSAESGSITYNEIGWSDTGSAGNNLFGQDIISGGVSLSVGQQLKVVVELSISFTPYVSTPYTNVVTGWTQDGDCVLERWDNISNIDADGSTHPTPGLLDPCTAPHVGISSDSAALVLDGSGKALDGAGSSFVGSILLSYSAGSRVIVCRGSFSVLQGNHNVRSVYLGIGNFSYFRVLLDANETKDSDHTLTLDFTRSWDRVLIN